MQLIVRVCSRARGFDKVGEQRHVVSTILFGATRSDMTARTRLIRMRAMRPTHAHCATTGRIGR